MAPRLLVVDDYDLFRRGLRRQLESEGYHVEEAADGNEALRCLERGRYDLVITDVQMPELDGLELLALIKKFWKDLPVLILTASLTAWQEQTVKRYGATVLIKSLDLTQLFQTVKTMLPTSPAIAPEMRP